MIFLLVKKIENVSGKVVSEFTPPTVDESKIKRQPERSFDAFSLMIGKNFNF